MIYFSLFFIITNPTTVVTNFPRQVVLRFLQGFIGGPVLATGGASAGDLFNLPNLPYCFAFWAFAAFGGPGLGLLLGAFAVKYSTWTWSMYEMLIIASDTWIVLFVSLLETNSETI